jgi:hypothetical protein
LVGIVCNQILAWPGDYICHDFGWRLQFSTICHDFAESHNLSVINDAGKYITPRSKLIDSMEGVHNLFWFLNIYLVNLQNLNSDMLK